VVTPGTAVVTSCSGVEEVYSARDIDGTLIKAGDTRFLLSPLNQAGAEIPEPRTGDTITIGAKQWRIQAVEPLAPAGLTVMYTLQLRG
jgi:hypothetical protein